MTPREVFWRLSHECVRERGRFALALVALLALSAAQLALTWLVKLWIDAASAGPGQRSEILIAAAGATVVLAASLTASRYLLNDINQRAVERLRARAQARLLAMTARAFRQLQSGDVIARLVADAELLSGFLRDVLRRLVSESVIVAGAVAMMFYLEWRLALATCAIVPMVALLLDRVGRIIRRGSSEVQQEMGALVVALKEQLAGWSTIKVFQTEAAEGARFVQRTAAYRAAVMRGEWWSGLLAATVWLVTGLGLLAVGAYGSTLVANGHLSAGALVAFGLYLIQTVEPLRRLSDVQTLLQRALAAAERVYALIDSAQVEPEEHAAPCAPAPPAVRFDSVHFAYRPAMPILSDLAFDLMPGERVALAGGSGAGKSTIAALLIRLIEPTAGRILFNDLDLRRLSLSEVRRSVCLVEHEPFIYRGTLHDNLRYGTPEASPAAIETAVAITELSELIAALPQGLETILEEEGHNFSTGQRQRIALARAIVRAPAVLVLDEATSGLDGDTEARIFASLERWLGGRTLIVISHRLATVARFDRILLLAGGQVVGDGSLAQLMQKGNAFAQLFGDQMDALERSEPSAQGCSARAAGRQAAV